MVASTLSLASPRALGRIIAAILVVLLLLVPAEVMAADEEPPGSTTTTIPDPTTTTTTSPSTTTTTSPDTTTTTSPESTTTTSLDTTTTTSPESTTTTTTGQTTTTSGSTTTSAPDAETPEIGDTPSPTGPAEPDSTQQGPDPLEEGESADPDELLPLPRIVFPLVGPASYSDTYGAPRDGGAREHLGTDISAPRGTPVVAVARGVVERIGNTPKAGLFVVVRHFNGWRSAYVHLNNDSPGTDNGLAMGFGPGIEAGVRVEPGTVLGYVGDSGNAEETSPHLHFELHQPDRLKANPYDALRKARRVRARLLPTVDYDDVVADGSELVGHLDTGTGFNADIAALGDHVYVGTWGNAERCPGTGVRVIDVTTPAEPVEITAFADHTEFPDTSAGSIWVGHLDTPAFEGDIGVVGMRRCDTVGPAGDRSGFVGVAIYDLADPVEPSLLSVVGSGITTEGVSGLDVSVDPDGAALAVAVPNSARDTSGLLGTVRLIDISDPSTPRPFLDWEPPSDLSYPSRIPFDEEMALSNSVSGVTWLDSATLALSRDSGDVLTIDVTDPVDPVLTSQVSLASNGLALAGLTSRVLSNGEYIIVNDVPAWAPVGGVVGQQLILDTDQLESTGYTTIASPVADSEADADPSMSGYVYPGGSTAQGPDRNVVAWMSAGVRIIDLADPKNPIERGHLVPAPAFDPQRWWRAPDGTERFPMVWDVAENDGYFYASDHHSGLWVFTVSPLPPSTGGADTPD